MHILSLYSRSPCYNYQTTQVILKQFGNLCVGTVVVTMSAHKIPFCRPYLKPVKLDFWAWAPCNKTSPDDSSVQPRLKTNILLGVIGVRILLHWFYCELIKSLDMCGGIGNGKNETNAFWWLGQLIQESKTKVKDDEDFKILI